MIDAEMLAKHAQMFVDQLRRKKIKALTLEQFLYFVRREIQGQIPDIMEVLKNAD